MIIGFASSIVPQMLRHITFDFTLSTYQKCSGTSSLVRTTSAMEDLWHVTTNTFGHIFHVTTSFN